MQSFHLNTVACNCPTLDSTCCWFALHRIYTHNADGLYCTVYTHCCWSALYCIYPTAIGLHNTAYIHTHTMLIDYTVTYIHTLPLDCTVPYIHTAAGLHCTIHTHYQWSAMYHIHTMLMVCTVPYIHTLPLVCTVPYTHTADGPHCTVHIYTHTHNYH